MPSFLTRRDMLATSTLAMAAALPATAGVRPDEDFGYEVTRTEEEWRAMLTEEEYGILRRGNTEWPKTSDLWQETRDGIYHCKGCELPIYSANWNVQLDKGWVFFKHADPNSIMTAIDGPVEQYGQTRMTDGPGALMEVHCRRCGSHLGHFLPVAGQNLHCINGLALDFRPA